MPSTSILIAKLKLSFQPEQAGGIALRFIFQLKKLSPATIAALLQITASARPPDWPVRERPSVSARAKLYADWLPALQTCAPPEQSCRPEQAPYPTHDSVIPRWS